MMQAANTDVEIWRRVEDDFYSPSIHATKQGDIKVCVGGTVLTASVEQWFAAGKVAFCNNTMKNHEQNYNDGKWYASTLGHFVGLLIDAGQDPAVCFRVVGDSEPDSKGKFTRAIRLLMLPDGYVSEGIQGCHGVHKTLTALLEAGVVK